MLDSASQTVRDAKAAMRTTARSRRAALREAAAAPVTTGQALVPHFRAGPELALSPAPGAVFSAYVPICSEIDPRPLMNHLIAAGLNCALPVVVGPGQPLLFRRWQVGEPLRPGPFQTQQPADDSPTLVPDLLLVPLLAYDGEGRRLGYGGGYYDRTLAAFRAAAPVCAVGLAFAGQMVETVPASPSDQPLDWVVTETGARRFRTTV